ncbi:MAG: hypothetical protein WKF58_07450 [Ilumatobacteraceae bacterium]
MQLFSSRARAGALTLLLLAPAALQTSSTQARSADRSAAATVAAVAEEIELSRALQAPATAGAAFGSRSATTSVRTRSGMIRTSVGCMESSRPLVMRREFRQRIGPVLGWDNPHVISLGGRRSLWLVHDSYMDYSFDATTLRETRPQIQNLAVIQKGSCFTLFHRGTLTRPTNFEPGVGADPPQFYFWPLGGVSEGDVIKVFWGKMSLSNVPRGSKDGIVRHPIGTYVAEYDAYTLERRRFYEAPSSRVKEPTESDFLVQYGFATVSAPNYTYLFGNPNMLNLAMNGGWANGPHPATRNYLARVPRGAVDRRPQYRTATGWSSDPADAVVISRRFYTENTMQPRQFGANKWVSITKEDGFFGDQLFLDVAPNPWGPWRTVRRIDYSPPYSQSTYQPILLPRLTGEGDLVVVIALNSWQWDVALDNPYLYRPDVLRIDSPFG